MEAKLHQQKYGFHSILKDHSSYGFGNDKVLELFQDCEMFSLCHGCQWFVSFVLYLPLNSPCFMHLLTRFSYWTSVITLRLPFDKWIEILSTLLKKKKWCTYEEYSVFYGMVLGKDRLWTVFRLICVFMVVSGISSTYRLSF